MTTRDLRTAITELAARLAESIRYDEQGDFNQGYEAAEHDIADELTAILTDLT